LVTTTVVDPLTATTGPGTKVVATSTVAVAPVVVSVTAHLVPDGTVSGGVMSVRPAGAPAGTANDAVEPLSQVMARATEPWVPAAGPATTLPTWSVAGTGV
jgi:hypothetical protein